MGWCRINYFSTSTFFQVDKICGRGGAGKQNKIYIQKKKTKERRKEDVAQNRLSVECLYSICKVQVDFFLI